jgi:hypothetical protein
MENTEITKEEYETLNKSFKETTEKLEEIKKKVKENYHEYMKMKYPDKFEKLEKFINKKITRLIPTEYEGENGEWADAIMINTLCDNNTPIEQCMKEFEIRKNSNWLYNGYANELEKVTDKEIKEILTLFYDEFPYVNTEYVE